MTTFVRAISSRVKSRLSHRSWRSAIMAVSLGLGILIQVQSAGLRGDDDQDAELKKQQQIVAKFMTVLEKNPRRGTALDRIYGHHVEWGTLDEFVKELSQNTEKNPKDAGSWMLLGLMEAQRGHDAEAITAFRQAEAEAPKNALASYYLGLSLNLIGQPEEAIAALERAIVRRPPPADLLEIYQQLGRIHQRAQRNDEALKVWSRLEADFPNDARVQEQIAVALLEEGQLQEALPRYESLAKKTKDDYRRTMYAVQAAELKIKLNRRDEGLKELEAKLNELNPDSWLHRDIRRRIEEVFLRSGDQDGLVAYYEKWIGQHADDVDGMARLARFLAKSARVPEATTWLEKALKLAPSRKELRIAFIDQLVDDQRYAEAAQQYEQLDKTDPNNPDYLRDWGRMILKEKQRSKEERQAAAQAIWNRLAESKAKDPLIAAQVADLFRHQNMSEPALSHYRRAVELSPDEPQYREFLGEYLHLLKQTDEALAVWQDIVAGKRRNVVNVARLAEVLTNHGYHEQAAKTIAEACQLDPKDLTLQLKAADYHVRAQKYSEAIGFIDAASKLAANDDERETVLNERVKALQSSHTLDDEIDAFAIRIAPSTSARDWYVLARYYEADRRQADGTSAIQKSLDFDPKSIPALTAAARISEQAGNLGVAADRFRQLAETDRRFRSEHLTNVARLESNLGRTAEALAAGKALIAAAPGNTGNYETYAELCFRLGQSEEGLQTLRKAIRINPTESSLMMALASRLTEQLKTDEAIQTYWQAFEKTESNEDRVNITVKLAELHLQINQLDKLVERLERDRREESKRRSLTICLAQVHHTAGDFGAARQELQSLLSQESRDSELLMQLAKLCEAEQDFESALQYQQQLVRVAPSPETEYRLAQLFQSAGMREEASVLLTQLSQREEDPTRRLKSIDGLLRSSQFDSASAIIESMLREEPQNWELLYRDAVAWASQDRTDEARLRFKRILAMDLPLDTPGIQLRDRQKQEQLKAKTNAALGRSVGGSTRVTAYSPIERVNEIQRATGILSDYYYGGAGNQSIYTPNTFGEVRMASMGWLLKFEGIAGTADDYVATVQKQASEKSSTRQAQMDWLYLCSLRNDGKSVFEVARQLAKTGGRDEQSIFLGSLAQRTQSPDQQEYYDNSARKKDTTPPLADEDIELMLQCVKTVQETDHSPNSVQSYRRTTYINSVGKELKRANRDTSTLIGEFSSRQNSSDLHAAILWAVNEQHVDKALELYDKWSKLQLAELDKSTRTQFPQYRGNELTTSMMQLMGRRALEKANDDVLRIMDKLLDHSAAAAAIARSRPARQSMTRASSQSQGFQTWYGDQQNYIQIDFPPLNDYFDFSALYALRQAYDNFKRNDVVSDLVPHLRRRLEKASGLDKIQELQGIGSVLWWNDEKEDAAKEFVAIGQLAPQDNSLKIELATMHQALGNFDAALEVVDQITPRDQKLLQTKELMALQFAERLGDTERARTAAERLFGVRLDAATQLSLAGHMRRLGLSALADAITSRAERSSGNQLNSQLTLMTLYQGQGKMNEAAQLAHQVLRRTTPSTLTASSRRNRPNNQGDNQRQQALQFLAQIGQLPEMISRLEKAKSAGQGGSRGLAQLAELYSAAGKRDKALELMAEQVKQQPDDAMSHMVYAQQLEQMGKAAEACDQYLFVLKTRPELMADDMYRYAQIFQQGQKLQALAEVMDTINLKTAFRHSSYATNIVQQLMRNKDTRDIGVKVFRKVVKAFPSDRYLFQNIYEDEVWGIPEVFEMAKQSFIPTKTITLTRPWLGVDDHYSTSQDGKANSQFTRVLDAAKRLNKVDELRLAIKERLEGTNDWPGGEALLAMIDAKDGKKNEAEDRLRKLVADAELIKTLPAMGKWIVACEIDHIPELQPLAISMLEEAAAINQSSSEFQYSPGGRLVHLYQAANRRDDALKLLREGTKRKNQNNFDADYETYRRISSSASLAEQFLKFNAPVDGIRLYRELLSNTSQFSIAERYMGGNPGQLKRRCETGMAKALAALQNDRSGEGIRALMASSQQSAEGSPMVDLMLLTPDTQDLTKSNLTSGFLDLVKAISAKPDLQQNITRQLKQLSTEHPDDISLAITQCLFALQQDVSASSPVVRLLTELLDRKPLDEVEAGKRPNSRQRTQALNQIPLWLVARPCLTEPQLADAGEKLATRAVAAARRQLDFNFTASILYEWGQIHWQLGRHDIAEQKWSELLDATTVRPKSERKKQPTTAPVPTDKPAVPRPRGDAARPLSQLTVPGRFPHLALAIIGSAPQPTSAAQSTEATAQEANLPPLTYPQFHSTMSIAKVAAEHRMYKLSFRAVDEALKAGPPIQLDQDSNLQRPGAARARRVVNAQPGRLGDGSNPTAESFVLVARSLRGLAAVWERNDFPAEDVYAILAPAMLPPKQPGEIKIYVEDDGLTSGRSTSFAATVINWALRANKIEELQNVLRQRGQQKNAELSAHVALTLIALRMQDDTAATESLQKIAEVIKKDRAPENQSLAGHAAVIGFSKESLRPVVVPIVLDCLQARNAQDASIDGEFTRRLYVYLGANQQRETVKQRLDEYLNFKQGQNSRYSGDYGLYQQQMDVARAAQVASSSGLPDIALDYLGRAADIPAQNYGTYGSDRPIYSVINYLATRPAEEQYETLSTWTLPTPNRKLVRFELTWNRPNRVSPVFSVDAAPKVATLTGPTRSNFQLLANAAKTCGTLDDLLAKASAAATEDIPNAKQLQLYLLIFKGDYATAAPLLAELTSSVEKRINHNRSNRNPAMLRAEYLIASNAMEVPELRDKGIEYARQLRKIFQHDAWTHLHAALAKASIAEMGLPQQRVGSDPGLKFWKPFSIRQPNQQHEFADPAWWIPQENSIVHISGAANDLLTSRFPIAGTFELSFETICASYSEGSVGYAGIIAEAVDVSPRVAVSPVDEHEELERPDGLKRNGEMNQITLRFEDGKVKVLTNSRQVYEEDAGKHSPWLMLRGVFNQRIAFNNVQFSGTPTIPREVSLLDGNRLDGWIASYFNESQPRRRILAEPDFGDENNRNRQREQEPSLYDWEARNGELIGNRRDDKGIGAQSRLYYFRPLEAGDRVQYEFFYEPGQTEVHPTIGNVAYILNADGVQLHWMTEPNWDTEVFGVEPSNLVDDPSATKASGPLPLKRNDWNLLQVELADKSLVLKLNDQKIYERPIVKNEGSSFGVFRYKDQWACRIRNVILRGNWPETFPQEMLANPFAAESAIPAEVQKARHAAIGDEFDRFDAPRIWQASLSLSDEERYQYLKEWVLPNERHPVFRNVSVAIPAGYNDSLLASAYVVRLPNGGRFAAPSWELLKVAENLNRIKELRELADKGGEESSLLRRTKWAFQLMLAAADHDAATVQEKAQKLQAGIDAMTYQLTDSTRLSDFAATMWLIDKPELHPIATELAQKQIDKLRDLKLENWVMPHLSPVIQAIKSQETRSANPSAQMTQWQQGSTLNAEQRGKTHFESRWLYQRGQVSSFPAETPAPLYYQSPLTGDFEVTAEVSLPQDREAVISFGMAGISPFHDRKGAHTIAMLKNSQRVEKEIPAGKVDDFAEIQLVVKDQKKTWSINGVEIQSSTLESFPDPWLGMHPRRGFDICTVRNVRISGTPKIPDFVPLSNVSDLVSWRSDIYGDRFGKESENPHWFQRGDEIVGQIRKDRKTENQPSMMTYLRPLSFDGDLTYEFYYIPKTFEVHPAFDHTCWLISPEGIRQQHLSDAQWEFSEQLGGPVKVTEYVSIGSAISLKSDDWNTVKLSFHGNEIIISVNGQEAGKGTITAENNRQFGLFRYSERNQCRVKNVVWRGNWPKSIPPIAAQELAIPDENKLTQK